MNKYETVEDHVAFVRQNGERLHSILSLREALEHMSHDEFTTHVNSQKNDFANWIDGVFKLHDLAKRVRETSQKSDLIKLLHSELYGKLPLYMGGVFKKKEHNNHIAHLDHHLAHMTRHEHHTTSRHPGTSANEDESIKSRLLDFSLGLIVGLLLGLILGKSIGIF